MSDNLTLDVFGVQQAYIQPKGTLPWIVRAVWRRGASPESYCWIISDTTTTTATSSTVTADAVATICSSADTTAGTDTATAAGASTTSSAVSSAPAAVVGGRETDERHGLSLSLQSLARHNTATESINLGDAEQLNSSKHQLKRHSSSSSGTNTRLHTTHYSNTADDTTTVAQKVVRVPRVASVSDVSDAGNGFRNGFHNGSARGCNTGRSSAYSSSAIGSSSTRGSRSIVKSCAKQSWSAPREMVTALAEGLATSTSSTTAGAGAAAVHCDELAADFVQDTRCAVASFSDAFVLAIDASVRYCYQLHDERCDGLMTVKLECQAWCSLIDRALSTAATAVALQRRVVAVTSEGVSTAWQQLRQ
jgi:hypothetical protein